MSSDEDLSAQRGEDDARAKKRRIQRACDICRRKKIRCDGSQMINNRCSNCIAFNFDCTYVEAAKKRGPPKGFVYVESLENRLEKMEKLLQRLCPGTDFTKELGASIDREAWATERERASTSRRTSRPPSPRRSVGAVPTPGSLENEEYDSSDQEDGILTLPYELRKLDIRQDYDRRFHGKSSGIFLLQAARQLKSEYEDAPPVTFGSPVYRRMKYWQTAPWEKVLLDDDHEPLENLMFPPMDLMISLIDLYFRHINVFLPLIHRPTFETYFRDGLHQRYAGFAGVVILICAMASKWSDDPRVLCDPTSKSSAGWHFFHQALKLKKNMFTPPTVFNLQGLALIAMFLQACSTPHTAWQIIGVGIRRAQDRGAHRRKVYREENRMEDEQWKRAWWCLIALDRITSSALGRPCACQDEDFDVDYPAEVDDAYWYNVDPEKAFKQPEDQVSLISYFNCHLRLLQILSFALRTIYAINKSKVLLGFVGPQWEQHIVAELDSALNKWIDAVPEHLRWDPNRENTIHFEQSVALYSSYYHIQILVHRPFIPTPRKPSPLLFPSLAICTNAARSCAHMLDIHRKRSRSIQPNIIVSCFTSAIVLLISVWGANKTGTTTDPTIQLRDVQKCIQTLTAAEDKWTVAGRLIDILRELASFGELPLGHGSPSDSAPSHKRERDSDTPSSTKWETPLTESPPQSATTDSTQADSSTATRRTGAPSEPVVSSPLLSDPPVSQNGGVSHSLPQSYPHYQPASRLAHLKSPDLKFNQPISGSPFEFQSNVASSSSVNPSITTREPEGTWVHAAARPSIFYQSRTEGPPSFYDEGAGEDLYFGNGGTPFTTAAGVSNVAQLFTLSESEAAFIAGQTQFPPQQLSADYSGDTLPHTTTGVGVGQEPFVGSTFDMWSGGASGFQWNDWSSYLDQAHPLQGTSNSNPS